MCLHTAREFAGWEIQDSLTHKSDSWCWVLGVGYKASVLPHVASNPHRERQASLHQRLRAVLQTSQDEAARPVRPKLRNAHVTSAALRLSTWITRPTQIQGGRQTGSTSQQEKRWSHVAKECNTVGRSLCALNKWPHSHIKDCGIASMSRAITMWPAFWEADSGGLYMMV